MSDDKKPLRGEELSRLYFQKKTTEQQLEEDKRLAEMQLARRPQQPRLKVALVGSFLVAASVYLIGKVPTLWGVGGTPGISFTFLVGLLLCYGFIRWGRYVLDVFYAYESPSGLFWIIFSMLSMAVGAVWLNALAGTVVDLWLIPLSLAHMVLAWVSLRFLLHASQIMTE